MAAGVATPTRSSTDARARLQSAKVAEQRRRSNTGFMQNLPGLRQARTAMLGLSLMNSAAPQLDDNAYSPDTQQTQSMTAGETYQRAFRQRQLSHQIGESVGLELSQRPEAEEATPIDDIQQDYAGREAQLLENNQRGLDNRSTFAKRAEQKAIQESGLQEGLQALQDEGQKRLAAFTANSAGAAAEAIDSACEDGGLTEGLVFVQNQVQAVRTILSPEPPEVTEITSLQDLKSKFTESFLDTLAPRFKLSTPEGIEGLLKAMVQWFFIAMGMTLLILNFIVIYLFIDAIHQFMDAPLASLFGFVSSLLGF